MMRTLRRMARMIRTTRCIALNPGRVALGSGNVIGNNLRVVRGAHLTLENEATVGEEVYVMADVKVGRGTMVSSRVAIIGNDHPYRAGAPLREQTSRFPLAVTIGSDCLIGFGAILVGPLTIGDGSLVGAGSVVTKDVPDKSVVAGNPAQKIADRR